MKSEEQFAAKSAMLSELRDYTFKKSSLYKGKLVPKGMIWLIVRVKHKVGRIDCHKPIPLNLEEEKVKEIVVEMRKLILKQKGI